ncbi:peptidoglycan-binding protein LysM [Flavivirga jejuensis]|uniref:Peptidoglycan-binding protein LysM n=1 Tax=Flavivirga jejuensis TaxID=870487 RepID=A0ABT8WRB5_9FLAO|nr:peptidoglycan-binding protein LysM [Flavivirga jejuensis]MDO5975690.1 peptidoglycan-binding protein LysM [Flavivirga jejuensis]
MGLFSFIKKAGAEIFGIGNADPDDAAEVAAEELRLEKAAVNRLKEIIKDFELKVEKLDIFIDGDVAMISGLAYDQATKEKVVLIVGNSNGIAIVDDQMIVEHVAPIAQFHTVVSGDTLGEIAKGFYNDAMKYPIIFEANKPMLTHPDKIYPGQLLRIPVLD